MIKQWIMLPIGMVLGVMLSYGIAPWSPETTPAAVSGSEIAGISSPELSASASGQMNDVAVVSTPASGKFSPSDCTPLALHAGTQQPAPDPDAFPLKHGLPDIELGPDEIARYDVVDENQVRAELEQIQWDNNLDAESVPAEPELSEVDLEQERYELEQMIALEQSRPEGSATQEIPLPHE